MIKKIFAVIAAIFTVAACSSCGAKKDEGISQLRTDIMTAEADGAKITVYLEEREIPLAADGSAGARTPVVIVRIADSSVINGTYSFSVSFEGKEYTGSPELKGDSMLSATIPVDKLPSGSLDLKVTGEKEYDVTMHTALPEHASWEKAFEKAKTAMGETVKYDGDKPEGEFFVRVLLEEGNVFWYVGYITNSGTLSVLVSGDGENVLAEHRSNQ